MNNQKIQVKYKAQTEKFDTDLVQNLKQLRLAINVSFKNLPPAYEIKLQDAYGQTLTQEEFNVFRLYLSKDVILFIKPIEEESDVLSINSEIYNFQAREDENLMREYKIEQARKNDNSFVKDDRFQQFSTSCKIEQKEKAIFDLKQQKIDDPQIFNEDVQCNQCFMFPIQGVIYKCLVCKDYDLCSKCQVSMHHYHPLLKIAKKNQYPSHIKAVFSKQSKQKMQRLEELDKLNQQRRKKVKYQKEIKEVEVIDPKTLPIKKVYSKNFLSELVGSLY